MNVPAITMLIWFGVAASAAAQGAPSGKAAGGSSKVQLSEVRTLVHELEARTEKLRDLMSQYRSLVEQRPEAQGGSPEAKQAHEAQLAKWNTALDRLLRRVDEARAAVVEMTQRLDQSATGQLPTALAKDVASARNEAGAQRTAAEQALAKSKPRTANASKRGKQTPATEKPAPPIPDDL
jgi:uncharacterized protein YukE